MERQNKGSKRARTQAQIAAEIRVNCREYKRNAIARGGYLDNVVQQKADKQDQKEIKLFYPL